MSMMWPPHSVKIVSTPSFFSAFATRCPPETTPASRLLRLSVSSAVEVAGAAGTGLAFMRSPRSDPFVTQWGGAPYPSTPRRVRHRRRADRRIRRLRADRGEVLGTHRLEHEQPERGGHEVAGDGEGE